MDQCQRCSSPLDDDGYCTDATCPFSDHPQTDDAGWYGHPEWRRNQELMGVKTKTIFVGVIEHGSGVNIYADETEDGLKAQIHGYIRENWEDEITSRDSIPEEPPPEQCPVDAGEAIKVYFETYADLHEECLTIEEIAVGGAG